MAFTTKQLAEFHETLKQERDKLTEEEDCELLIQTMQDLVEAKRRFYAGEPALPPRTELDRKILEAFYR